MLTWTAFLSVLLCISCKGWYISNNSEVSEDMLLNEELAMNYNSLELPDCKDKKFIEVLAHFRVVNPEDLFLLAMKGYEPNLCRDLTVGTDKIVQYLKHCYPTSEQDLYLKLLSGLDVVKQKLCDDPDFSSLFKRNEECYGAVRYETEPCVGPQDWLEYRNISQLCRIMKDVIGCYYTKTLLNCDLAAAEVLNDIMKSIMYSIIDENCPNIVQENYVRDLRSLSRTPESTVPLTMMSEIIICLIVGGRGMFY